jgi:polar amino acid transport system substrate-binding protein
MTNTTRPTRRDCLSWGAAVAASALLPGAARATPLETVRNRGSLIVAIYNDLPPFHTAGKGIDVEIAQGLADSLGVKLSLMPFNADENMGDDLRNMVWKGHYLGFGPADVMLHVPVDQPLMAANPQILALAPYYRERVAIARRLADVPELDSFAQMGSRAVAVPGQSLAGWLMLGADGGAYKQQLTTQWKDGAEAAQALVKGEVPLAAGLLSELESVVKGDPRFAITPLPSPRAPRDGWAVGMAVKKADTDLARALQEATNTLVSDGRMARAFARASVNWRPV